MPRHGKTPKRKIRPDVIYNSVLAQRFINKMMIKGKKSKAENIFYRALDEIKKKLSQEPLAVFEKAMTNVCPLLEVKARRVGGATYQVPVEISKDRAQAMAMQWLREGARERGGKSMVENLANELIDASNNTGVAIKNKETLHKTAEVNKAFAHFRW